jgi:hypothetical protein
MLDTGEKKENTIFVFFIFGLCSGVACLLGLLGGILVNSPLAQRENSPLPRYSCPPPLQKEKNKVRTPRWHYGRTSHFHGTPGLASSPTERRKIRLLLLAGTTGELPTSTILLPSSPTKRRKIRKVLLAGTTRELPTSMILLDSSPTEKDNN